MHFYIRKNIFACLFSVRNTISFPRCLLIDDVYFSLKLTHLENIFHHINNLYQNINFTMGEESNGELASLDTSLK